MRKFFEPTGPDVPRWLRSILTSIRSALGDPWDTPLRFWPVATADLPTASRFTGGAVWNATTLTVNWSDGTTWNAPQASSAELDAIAAVSTAGILVRQGAATWITRTIQGTANEITVTNGDGVLATPTFSLPAALTFTGKTITGGTYGSTSLTSPTVTGTMGAAAATFSGSVSFSGGATFTNAGGASTTWTAAKTLSAWTVGAGTYMEVGSGTLTDNFSSGGATVATRYASRFGSPTFDSTNAITVTTAATFQIGNAPVGTANTVITNAYALLVSAGAVRFGGAFEVLGNCTFGDNVADAHNFTGQVTVTESAGAALVIKDNAGNGTAADLTLEFQGADAVVVGQIGKVSSANANFDVNAVAGDLRILTTNALQATFDTDGLNLVSGNWYEINGTKVVEARKTGWGAPTGTPTRTTFATGTVTLPQLAERVKALIDDLTTHGLIGP